MMKKIKKFRKYIIGIIATILTVLVFWGCCNAVSDKAEPTTKTGQAETTETEEQTKSTCVLYYDVPLEKDIQEHIFHLCAEYEIDPKIVIAMIAVESNYDAGTVSEDLSSVGLMQVQPKYHRGRMTRLNCHNLYDPYMNVTVAIDYLAELKVYNPDINFMIAAYKHGIVYANSKAESGYYTEYVQNVLKTASELKLKGAADDVLY